MSLKYMVSAFDTKLSNPVRKLIYLKLADNANDQGHCFPSLQHIADKCECDRRTVIRHIKWLEENKYLVVERKKRANNENYPNVYKLTPSDNLPLGGSDTGSLPSDTGSLGGSDTGSPKPTTLINHPLNQYSKPQSVLPVSAQRVMEIWNDVFEKHYPRTKKFLSDTTKRRINTLTKNEFKTEDDWELFFRTLTKSDFLMGKIETRGRKPFQLSLEWAIKEANIIKIMEGAYHG